MKLTFKDCKWTTDAAGFWLCLNVKEQTKARALCDGIKQEDNTYQADIDRYRPKRSLDANAYFWVLCGKLAAILRITTTEIYQWCIREIGDNFFILPIISEGVDEWRRIWAGHGTGWIVEDLGECKHTLGYRNIKSYYGSSVYNSAQMSRLIDIVVEACKEQGIETATPDEIALMKARWADAQQKDESLDDSPQG